MYDEFPFGCSPYKGQSLCMWVMDVSFSLWYMSCVNCICFGWCSILIYRTYFGVRKIYWRNNFHKFGLAWPNPLNYTSWDFLILGWNPTPIDRMVGFIYNQRKKIGATNFFSNASFLFGLVISFLVPSPSFFSPKVPQNFKIFYISQVFILGIFLYLFYFIFESPSFFLFCKLPSPLKEKKTYIFSLSSLFCFVLFFWGGCSYSIRRIRNSSSSSYYQKRRTYSSIT